MFSPKPPRRLTSFLTSALLLLLTLAGLLWVGPEVGRVRAAGFVVTNTDDSGQGSLRQAILDANANPGPDSISFQIPGAGVHTIKPLSPLPVVTGPVLIDGFTQPGSAPNTVGVGMGGGSNAVLLVELDGSAAGAGANGLEITGGSTTVRGLVINRFVGHGIVLSNKGDDRITGCYIGTNAAGTAAFGNAGDGVRVLDTNAVTVGGATAGAANLISGNGGDGVHIGDGGAGLTGDMNTVQGNLVGVGSDGGALPNAGNGVHIFGGSNTVGGENAGEGNEIANNGSDGVEVASGVSNSVRGNSIHSNTGLGIELREGGQPDGTVTPNDPLDADAGPNSLQNFPTITSATSSVNSTNVSGTLSSTPGSGFRIDFYSSPTCDASGNGEGRTYLGSRNVATDDGGVGAFTATLTQATTVGHVITATLTGEAPSTSEFSPCRVVAAPTFTWDGSADTNWHNGANWDMNSVPTAADIVVIPSGNLPNEPSISTADAAAAGVNVQAGRTLTVTAGRTLTSGATTVNAGGALNVAAGQAGRLAGALTLDGALTGGDAASVFRFDGATLTNNGTVSVNTLRFGGASQTLAGTGAVTSGLTEVLAGAAVTLGSSHALGNLSVNNGGSFSQGASFDLTVGKLVINSGGVFQNVGTGDLTLAGDVSNDGALTLNGGGAACGDTDSILLRSSDPAAQRAWAGAGSFSLSDVDVSGQAGTAQVAVRSGTNSGNNGANWLFTVCPAGSSLTVNTNDDGDDGACNAAHCSLREAILTANSTPGQVELIRFQIGNGGAQTISPASALPTITDAVTIDATTQPGFGGSPLVELNGAGAGAVTAGLNITAGGSTVRGLVVNRFNGHGVRVSGGFNTVAGNLIGTNAAGTAARANAGHGVLIDNTNNCTVGGNTAADRNVISGNGGVGVLVSGGGAGANRIRGNFIGTQADGLSALPNLLSGVHINNGATGNFVGGTNAGEGNRIAFNGGDGVSVSSGTNNRVLANSIHTNGTTAQHLGIDLDADGTSPNDAGDADAGANTLQNFPLINSAASDGAATSVAGSLNSTASTAFRVEFFSNAACDASGNGEGANLLGAADVTTDGSGGAVFNVQLPNVAVGQIITATATNPAGNTSEFSACRAVVAVTYTLSGRVTDGNAQPLQGVGVHLSGSSTADTTTDAAGNYSFSGLQQGGSFTVTPSANGHIFTPPSRSVNNLQSDRAGLDFTGQLLTYTISGTVVDGGGVGLAGVNVHLSGSAVADTLTDAAGNYSFANLQHGGSFTLTPSKANYSFIPPSRTVGNLQGNQTGLDFTGALNFHTLSGRVTDAGAQPLVGVNVRLSGSADRDTTTDAAGNYSFAGLPAGGSFTVTPTETGYRFTPPNRSANSLQSDQAGLDFTGTFITYTIAGRIVDAGGAGLSGVSVTLAGARSAAVVTGASGNYSFGGVPAGGRFVLTPARDGFSFNPPNLVIGDNSADVSFNTVGAAEASPTPTPDPSDDFEGGPEPDPNRWAEGVITAPTSSSFDPLVNVFLGGGLLHIEPRADANGPSFNGLVSVRAIDLNVNPTVSVELVRAAQGDGAQTVFGLGADPDNYVRFLVQNASEPTPAAKTRADALSNRSLAEQTLLFQLNLGGNKFSAGVTYDPVRHRFWRFRHEAPARLVVFETSPDFVAWTERFRARLPADQATLIAELSAGTTRASANPGAALFDNFIVSPSPRVQFETSALVARESDGAARVGVLRTGGDENPLTVAYTTAGGTANAGGDYAPVSGTLVFQAGERLKSFTIPIVNDDLTEAGETVGVLLSNPLGGRLGTIAQATLTILDDESENPINDTSFFVRRHYLDFLGREPDAEGLQFWTGEIRQCGADLRCREVRRINVSAAFFLSIEFQGTGYFVQRLYRLSYGRLPTFAEYQPDLTAVREGVIVGRPGALERLELNKRAFVELFVKRAPFKAKYDAMNEAQYVDALAAAAGVTLPEEERTAHIVNLLTQRDTRGNVLLKLAEKEAFIRAEFRPAFVQMEYFGYLRRDPDAAGFNFWLKKLNDFNGDYVAAEMVKAFLDSAEYRSRFGQP